MDHGLAGCASRNYKHGACHALHDKIDGIAAMGDHLLPKHKRRINSSFINACFDIDSVIVLPSRHSPRPLHEWYQSRNVCTPPILAWETLRSIMHQLRPHVQGLLHTWGMCNTCSVYQSTWVRSLQPPCPQVATGGPQIETQLVTFVTFIVNCRHVTHTCSVNPIYA